MVVDRSIVRMYDWNPSHLGRTGSREKNASIHVAFSISLLIQCRTTVKGRCHQHSGWIFPPQSFLKTPSKIYPMVCLLGDSEFMGLHDEDGLLSRVYLTVKRHHDCGNSYKGKYLIRVA